MDILLDGKLRWGDDEIIYMIVGGDAEPEALLPDEWALLAHRNHPRRRHRYCLGRLGIQEALRRNGFDDVVGTPVVMDEQGKSYWGGDKPTNLSFSIAHHGEVTVIALAPESVKVGVDIEKVAEMFDRQLEPLLTPEEKKFVESMGPEMTEERNTGATALWVAKEALSKSTGGGWMAHQQDFPLKDIHYSEDKMSCKFSNGEKWHVETMITPWGMVAISGIQY